MLYNKNWDAKTITPLDANSRASLLQSLISWLEQQDPRTTYSWGGHCLLEQWSEAVGLRNLLYRGDIYYLVTTGNGLACQEPHTFGAALDRARAAHSQLL